MKRTHCENSFGCIGFVLACVRVRRENDFLRVGYVEDQTGAESAENSVDTLYSVLTHIKLFFLSHCLCHTHKEAHTHTRECYD